MRLADQFGLISGSGEHRCEEFFSWKIDPEVRLPVTATVVMSMNAGQNGSTRRNAQGTIGIGVGEIDALME